jgi:hypothetical protein
LLLPSSGAAFSASQDAITLQWAAVADLRENELYRVTVEDLTAGNGRILVEYVRDTRFILPTSFRPLDTTPTLFSGQWLSRAKSTAARPTRFTKKQAS